MAEKKDNITSSKTKTPKKKKVNSPVTKGVAKVPVVMQMEALECGAACLAMVCAYYDKWIALEQIRVDCGVSRDGANAKSIVVTARQYGLKAKGYRFEIEDLKKEGKFPCIIHWNFSHFVVLCGIKNNKAYINDPAKGHYVISMEKFDESFTGIVLMFEPDENFVPSGRRKSIMKFALKRLSSAKVAVAFVVLTTLISALIGVISPAFSRIFMDRLLTKENPEWFWPFINCLVIFYAIQVIVDILETFYRNRINAKLAAVGSSTFLWRILHLPMEFFSQRLAGDIQNRQSSNESIASEVVNTFSPMVLNFIMMIFYLVVMVRYSWILTLVGLCSIIINMIMARIITKKRINVARVQMRDAGKFSAASIAGVEMIETIKSSGAENGFFEKWAGYQANVNSSKVKYSKIDAYLGLIPTIVSTLTGSTILFLGIWFCIEGNFTVGMISAFQGLLTSFMSPATTLISCGQTFQEMRTQMERIDDVLLYPLDKAYDTPELKEGEHPSKLEGNIQINDLTFGYSRLAEPIVKNINIDIKKGGKIAIVGPSGCGKSTISKLISGLYQPWSGQILYDGKPLNKINRDIFTSSVAVVDQDIILFEDSISNNIKMWDSSIDDTTMVKAGKDAQIHDELMLRDGGYDHKILEGGKDFSGGQRQRIEIARVLAQEPTIVILDEATSALDAKTENEVVEAITQRGITMIIVAHRLSTIRDADEILVMEKGEIVERGTHEQLYAKGGKYTELVSND